MKRYGFEPVENREWVSFSPGLVIREFRIIGKTSHVLAIVSEATNSLSIWKMENFKQIVG